MTQKSSKSSKNQSLPPLTFCTEYDDLTRKLEQRELQLTPLKLEELLMNSL